MIDKRKKQQNYKESFEEDIIGRFTPFFTKFPEIAMRENKILEINFADSGNPKVEYLLIESFCESVKCDCRKVMINLVDKRNPKKVMATIGFGWESLEFYKKWAFGDEWLAKQVKGVYLEPGGIQTEYSKSLLDVFENYLKDSYIKLIKRHYSVFKNSLKNNLG